MQRRVQQKRYLCRPPQYVMPSAWPALRQSKAELVVVQCMSWIMMRTYMHHTFILCSHSQGSTQPLPRHSTVLHIGSFSEFISDTDQYRFKLGSFEFLEGSLLLEPFKNTSCLLLSSKRLNKSVWIYSQTFIFVLTLCFL